jgi:UDP-glucose 4-epimerase
MRVVVTGGAGFIGSHLLDCLVPAGHTVLVVDNFSSGKRENLPPLSGSVDVVEADQATPKALEAIAAFRPDAVVVLAAQLDVRYSVADPAHDAEVNIVGTIRVVEAARKAGAKAVLFASSGGVVYGEQEQFPAPETHPTRPASPYGVSKRTGELYLECFRQNYGLRYSAMRFANVYGPRQNPHGEAGVIAIFAQRMLKGQTVTIYGDGSQTRDFVTVTDIALACEKALDRLLADPTFYGTFNIGTATETSVLELATEMADILQYKVPFNFAPARTGELARSCVDFALAKRELGWSPQTSLRAGLTATIDHIRSVVAKEMC